MPSGSATDATGRSRGGSSSTAPANCTARLPRACGWWKRSFASRCARATTHNACWPRFPKAAARCSHVSQPVFEKLAFGQRAEGVLGVAETPRPTLSSLAVPENALVAVLEGVEKPGNLGAVLRSADAAGVSAVIVADGRTDLYNPNAIRASLGTIFTMPVCEAASGEVLAWLRQRKYNIFAARVDGSVAYTAVDYRGPTAIVLGSEAAGLSSVWTGDDIRPSACRCSAWPTA